MSAAPGPGATAQAGPVAIPVRRPEIELDDDLPRYWMRGEPFATHLLDALSSTFPDGEAFFVRAVRHYASRIDDPTLRDAVRGFAGQEGVHAHEHRRHVELLARQGYTAIPRRNAVMARIDDWIAARLPRASLATTAALEHLTALLARRILEHDARFTSDMDPRMARLWQWHALEEAEHKAVAFDVFQHVSGSHRLRVLAQLSNSFFLVLEVLERTAYMLHEDGLLFRREGWAGGWRFLFGERGLLRGLGRDYRAWYRRDFHPSRIDDRALVEHWRSRLFGEGTEGGAGAAAAAAD